MSTTEKIDQLTYQLQHTNDHEQFNQLLDQINALNTQQSYTKGLNQGYNRGFQDGAALTIS